MTTSWIWPLLLGLALCPRRHETSRSSYGWVESDFWRDRNWTLEVPPNGAFEWNGTLPQLVDFRAFADEGVRVLWLSETHPDPIKIDGSVFRLRHAGSVVVRFENATGAPKRGWVRFIRAWHWW